MSDIDTFDHEFVGFFAGLPVYRGLETNNYPQEGVVDIPCSPQEFIIGGGGGEHPALVIRDPNAAVIYFLREWLEEESGLEENDQTKYEEGLFCYPKWSDVLHYCNWGVDNFHRFFLRCSSPALWTPYNEESFGGFENWLYISFGELIFFSFPELAQATIKENEELASKIEFSFMNNILIQPSGYKPRAGRITIDGDIKFSLSSWNVKKRA